MKKVLFVISIIILTIGCNGFKHKWPIDADEKNLETLTIIHSGVSISNDGFSLSHTDTTKDEDYTIVKRYDKEGRLTSFKEINSIGEINYDTMIFEHNEITQYTYDKGKLIKTTKTKFFKDYNEQTIEDNTKIDSSWKATLNIKFDTTNKNRVKTIIKITNVVGKPIFQYNVPIEISLNDIIISSSNKNIYDTIKLSDATFKVKSKKSNYNITITNKDNIVKYNYSHEFDPSESYIVKFKNSYYSYQNDKKYKYVYIKSPEGYLNESIEYYTGLDDKVSFYYIGETNYYISKSITKDKYIRTFYK